MSVEVGERFDNRWSAIPRIDPDGRAYPPDLLNRIANRMKAEDAGYDRTTEIAAEEIAAWKAEQAEAA